MGQKKQRAKRQSNGAKKGRAKKNYFFKNKMLNVPILSNIFDKKRCKTIII